MAGDQEDDPHEVDELIFNWCYLEAIQRIRERSGCSLREAINALGSRIDQLRVESPDQFTSRPEGWEFYT